MLEQYLRIFCDYQQNNWHELLPLAEFAYNNAKHTSTQTSPFFTNYGRHPRFSLRVTEFDQTPSNPSAEDLVETLKVIHESLRHQLISAQDKYKQSYDTHVKLAPLFKIGDLVWLSRRNITTTRLSQKQDHKRLGPFRISEVVGESKSAFKLELPARMKVHPVFHVSLLTPYRANMLPGRVQPPPPPVVVEGFEEFEVEEILDSWIHYNKL